MDVMVDKETAAKKTLTMCGFCGLAVSPEHDLIELSESKFAHLACVESAQPEETRKFIAFENAYGPRL